MAEHDAERTGSDEEREPRPTESAAVPEGTKPASAEGAGPEATAPEKAAEKAPEKAPETKADEERVLDEEAAWAAIVAGYGRSHRTRRAPSPSSRSRTWPCWRTTSAM